MATKQTNTESADEAPEVLTTQEAAKFLRVSAAFLVQDRFTHRHGIRFVPVGRRRHYLRSDLVAWLQSQSAKSAQTVGAK